MASYRTAVWRGEDGGAMPTVIRVELPEGAGGGGDRIGPHYLLDPHSDDRRYFRRYAEDVRAEFKRAMARRRFFTFWTPDMEAA